MILLFDQYVIFRYQKSCQIFAFTKWMVFQFFVWVWNRTATGALIRLTCRWTRFHLLWFSFYTTSFLFCYMYLYRLIRLKYRDTDWPDCHEAQYNKTVQVYQIKPLSFFLEYLLIPAFLKPTLTKYETCFYGLNYHFVLIKKFSFGKEFEIFTKKTCPPSVRVSKNLLYFYWLLGTENLKRCDLKKKYY